MDNLGRVLRRGGDGNAQYREMRARILGADPSTIQVADGNWAGASVALMEMVVDDATASIVAVADGTLSLYLSTGGGTIGAGQYLSARMAGQRFLKAAAELAPWMAATTEFPLPTAGNVRFHVRTPDGDFTSEVPEHRLRARRDELAPLYLAGQDVLTEIRQIEEASPA
jgi:hypothetical protein